MRSASEAPQDGRPLWLGLALLLLGITALTDSWRLGGLCVMTSCCTWWYGDRRAAGLPTTMGHLLLFWVLTPWSQIAWLWWSRGLLRGTLAIGGTGFLVLLAILVGAAIRVLLLGLP